MTKTEADSWVIGIKRVNGMIGTITSNSYINPEEISMVYIPVIISDETDAFTIYESPLEESARYHRSMGPEVQYSAYIEGDIPNAMDFWTIELNVFEYPKGAFNMSQIIHTDNISIYDGDPEILLDQI